VTIRGGPRGVDFTEGSSGEAFEGGEGEGVVFEAGVEGTDLSGDSTDGVSAEGFAGTGLRGNISTLDFAQAARRITQTNIINIFTLTISITPVSRNI